MSDLHDRFERLAGNAPQGLPAGDLWERGRTRARRMRLQGVALAVACAVLAVALGGSMVSMLGPAEVAPATPGESVSLPDRLHNPSGWARTPTLADGPPGPLVVVMGGHRQTLLSDEMGVYGVTAGSGEYVWLDLPDLDESAPVSLSPDGTHVGYWLERDTAGDDEGIPDGDEVVDGYAVLDLVSGDVFRDRVETDLGLLATGIGWLPGQAWFEFSEYTEITADSSSASGQPTALVDLALGTVTPVALEDSPGLEGSASSGQGLVADTPRGGVAWITAADRAGWTRLEDRPALQDGLVADDEGTRFAGIARRGRSSCCQPGQIVVGTRDARGLRWRTVPGDRFTSVVGWRGPTQVLVRDDGARLHSVDVGTGAATPVVELAGTSLRQQPVFATALLDAPVVPGAAAPPAVDQRLWLAGALVLAGLLAVGVLALRGWRRRGPA